VHILSTRRVPSCFPQYISIQYITVLYASMPLQVTLSALAILASGAPGAQFQGWSLSGQWRPLVYRRRSAFSAFLLSSTVQHSSSRARAVQYCVFSVPLQVTLSALAILASGAWSTIQRLVPLWGMAAAVYGRRTLTSAEHTPADVRAALGHPHLHSPVPDAPNLHCSLRSTSFSSECAQGAPDVYRADPGVQCCRTVLALSITVLSCTTAPACPSCSLRLRCSSKVECAATKHAPESYCTYVHRYSTHWFGY